MSKNYTCVVFKDSKLHMTWFHGNNYNYPNGFVKGQEVKLLVVGKYSDSNVSCLIVTFDGHTHQPCGTLLHITTRCDYNTKPVESGRRATKYGYTKITPYEMNGVWL